MSNANPLVSIVIPTYNAANYLPTLCRSLQSQTYGNFEALILDDGSNDNTLEVLQTFEKDARFNIVTWKSNRGVGAATSELLNRVRGEFWCYPGADDVLLPSFIERRVKLLQAHSNACLAHGPTELIDDSDRPIPSRVASFPLPPEISGSRALRVLLQHNVIATSSVLVRSSVTRQILPHFESEWQYAQDWHLWLLHSASGFDLLWDPEPLVKYRVHSSSLTTDPGKISLREAEIRLVPLCTLATAAQLSTDAASCWARWRRTLYCLWLRRASKLWRRGTLHRSGMERGARAYYSKNVEPNVITEIVKHALEIILASFKEKRARRRQIFSVSGLAQIDDSLFR